MIRWPGEPIACTCTRPFVVDLADTLTCPRPWRPVPGLGWIHAGVSQVRFWLAT